MRKERITDEYTLWQHGDWKGCRRGYIVRCQRTTSLLLRIVLFFIAGLSLLALVESNTALADEYILIMSKKDKLCQHMLSLYNNDLKKFGNIEHDQHEEFTKIKWEKKILVNMYNGKRLEFPLTQTLLDINNDGQKEVVLKSSGHMGDVLTEDVTVFKNSDFDMQEEYIKAEFFHSKFIIRIGSFEKNQYYLKEMPAQEISPPDPPYKGHTRYCFLNGGYVNAFIFGEDTVVEMQSSYANENNTFFDWRIILEVTPENKLCDTCYYLKLKGAKEEQDGDNITEEGGR